MTEYVVRNDKNIRMTEGFASFDRTLARTGQRTANTGFLYPIEDQNVAKNGCSWS